MILLYIVERWKNMLIT
uniref:Uncharacterized protein n=1 Tax=Solanum lycopersicum TaxID=4081 RepID=A0A3Q7I3X8_SOLLC